MDKCPKVGDRVRTPRPGEPVSAPGLPGRLEHDPKWPTEVLVDRIGVAEVFDAHRRFEAEALAAELVRRWNAHAALVEELREMVERMRCLRMGGSISSTLYDVSTERALAILSPEERRG